MKISKKHFHWRYFRLELVLLAITIALYIPRLSDSLWLDEFAATDAVSRGFWDAASFLWFHMFPAPIFYALEWVAVQLLGNGEVALRILPFIFTLASGAALYVLTRRMTRSYEIAWTSALIFLNLPLIRDQGVTARPYPLSVFCCICAFYYLYFHQNKLTRLFIAASFAAVAVYGHLLMLVIPPALAAAVFLARRISVLRAGLFAISAFLLSLPLVVNMLTLWESRQVLYYTGFQIEPLFLYVHSIPILILACFVLLRRTGLLQAPQLRRLALSSELFGLLLAWAIIPLFGVIAIAYLGTTDITVFSRYLIGTRPALAIALALGIGLFRIKKLRNIALVILLLYFAISPHSRVLRREFSQDFRGLVARIASERQANEPILFFSCWGEGNDLERLKDPQGAKWLKLPLSYYGISDNIHLLPSYPFLPFYPGPEARKGFVREVLGQLLKQSSRWFVVPCYDVYSIVPFLEQLGVKDPKLELIGRYGMIPLYESQVN
jgi:hypothetical protein